MKQIAQILASTLFILAVFSSCYRDLSRYPTQKIDEIIVDTTGIPRKLFIGYQEELHLTPKFVSANPQDIKVEWWLAESIADRNMEMELIGESLELRYRVNRAIETQPYHLLLKLYDTAHENLEYHWAWEVVVQPSITGGLLVIETSDDGKSSDFTYIKNKYLTERYNGDDKVIRNLLQSTPTGAIPERVISARYSTLGLYWRPHTNWVWCITESGRLLRYNTETFTLDGDTAEGEKIMVYKPSNIQFLSMFKAGTFLCAQTNLGIYSMIAKDESLFTLPNTILQDVSFSNGIVATSTATSSGRDIATWLDEKNGCFCTFTENDDSYYEVSHYRSTSGAFDPNALSGKEAIAGEISTKNKVASFVLKDKNTGNYAIYLLNQYKPPLKQWDNDNFVYIIEAPEVPSHAKAMYTIPSSGKSLIDQARALIFSKVEDDNILYVVTEQAIFTMTYGMGDEVVVNTTPKYSVPAGERISFAKLYMQGQYAHQSNSVATSYTPELPWNIKAITVASQRADGKGVVRVLPLDMARPGEIASDLILEYHDFGKVLDVITIGL